MHPGFTDMMPDFTQVPPVVRVKAMATGKSAGFYQPYDNSQYVPLSINIQYGWRYHMASVRL
jgi:hypothetical protein